MRTKDKKMNFTMVSLGMAILLFVAAGCGNNQSNQNENMGEYQEPQQETRTPETDEFQTDRNEQQAQRQDEPQQTAEQTQTEQRRTYQQSAAATPDENKIVIDASSETFQNLDQDGDSIIRKDEFYSGLYGILDENNDNSVSQSEFENTANEFFRQNIRSNQVSFSAWDEDGNGQVSEQEFENRLSSIIDVADDETLAQNVYIIWHRDNDNRVEELELENVTVRFDADDN